MYNLKKYTQKDRYGNTITFEVERMQEPTVPSMQDIPQPDHPGGPRGTDTVPAWLTPGEFVMNAEATRMYEPMIKAMNDHGRAVQRQQGGTIPQYHDKGGDVGHNIPSWRLPYVDKFDAAETFVPGYTIPEETADAVQAFKDSRYLDALLGAGMVGLGVLPGGSSAKKAGKAVKESPYMKELDDHFKKSRQEYYKNKTVPANSQRYDPELDMEDYGEMWDKIRNSEGIPFSKGGEVPYSRDAYMAELIPAAKAEGERLGVDPRIIVAQSIQETGWGRKAPENAYFGIKSHGYKGKNVDFGTHEYENGQKVNMRDSFRGYDSLSDSVRGYGDFISSNPRYKPYMEAEGLDAQLNALGKSGYATDPNYAKNLRNIISGRTFRKYYRAEGSEEPEVPVMFEQPVPPNAEYVPVLDSGLYAMDPTNDAYPAEYEMDNYLYNASDEAYDAAMERGLDQASTQVDMLDAPEELQKQLDINAQERERQTNVPYDEFSDIPNNGGVEPLTADDQKKVEEGRVRREQDYAAQLADKLDRGESLTETEKTTLAELERSRKQIMPEPTYIDPDAEGEDMNNPDVQVLKTFADQYGEPDEAEFDKMDKEFANLPSSKDESSFLDNFISKDMQSSIGGFFSKMFNHALSDRALSALVMNYVGSRAMGYDHGASFQFAAKKYGKQIEAGQALEDKLYLSGKYKAPSIKRAMEKGDFGELELAKSGLKQTSNFKNFYRGGRTYRAQEFKDADGNSRYYTYDPVSKQTVPIDISFTDDGRFARGSKDYEDRRKAARSHIEKLYEAQEGLIGTVDNGDDPDTYRVQRRPVNLASDFIAWAEKNGFDLADPRTEAIIGNAYEQAVNDATDKGLTIKDLTPYLDQQMIRESTNSNELFMINRDKYEAGEQAPKYVRGDLMKSLYDKASATARAKGFKDEKSGRQAVFAHAVAKWGDLAETDPKAYAKYMKSGSKDVGTSPFYNFMNAEFDKIMKSMAEQ